MQQLTQTTDQVCGFYTIVNELRQTSQKTSEQKLSNINVCYQQIKNEGYLNGKNGLTHLPNELQFYLFSFLDTKHLLLTRKVCKLFHAFSSIFLAQSFSSKIKEFNRTLQVKMFYFKSKSIFNRLPITKLLLKFFKKNSEEICQKDLQLIKKQLVSIYRYNQSFHKLGLHTQLSNEVSKLIMFIADHEKNSDGNLYYFE